MKRYLLILLTALLAGCGQPKQRLNIFIWSEYIDPKIVADFEREFNCRVVIDLYEDPDSMMAKMAAGGVSGYDIVVPSNRTLPIMVKQGLVAPLRRENIPNLRNIDPQFTNSFFDPDNEFAPYHWGTTGLFARKPKGKPLDETWGLIFDPANQPGAFLLLTDLRACIGAALRFKGHSSNTTNREELSEARDLLVEAKKRSLGFESSLGCKNRVLAKGAALGMTYTGVMGTEEDPETYYFLPREGSEIWMDVLSVPAKAPHRDLAEKFINYFLEAKIAAQNAEFSRNATPNRAALEFLNPSVRTNPAIYPPPEVMRRLEFTRDLGEHNKLYDELWTQIKAK